MSEFKPINTQEEFNTAIRERLEEARNAVRQQFSDYETIKSSLASVKAESEKKDATITDLQKQLKGSRAELAKTRIALEKGLPVEMSDRLAGETEEEIRKDAEKLAALFTKPKEPAPLRDTEDKGGSNSKDAALRAVLSEIKNK